MILLFLLLLLLATGVNGQVSQDQASYYKVDTLAYGRNILAIANYDAETRWRILVDEYQFCTDSLIPLLKYNSSDSIDLGYRLRTFFVKKSPSGKYYLLNICQNYQSQEQNVESIKVVHPVTGKTWYVSENLYTKQRLGVGDSERIFSLLEEEQPWNFVNDDTTLPSKYLEYITSDTILFYSRTGDEPRTNKLIDTILDGEIGSP